MERLVYESYQAMKKKLSMMEQFDVKNKIDKQLCKVKKLYDKDSFLINKHNNIAMRKTGAVSYLPYDKWIGEQSKLKYYLKNIDEYASYKQFSYLFTGIDKDESYVIKGE